MTAMSFRRSVAALCVVGGVVTCLGAGSPRLNPFIARAATAGSQAAAGAGVLIKVPIIALDAQKRPIAGLQPADFTIQANEAPREATSVEPAGAVARTFLIIIDRNRLENADAQSASAVARAIVTALPPQDAVELVTLPAINRRVTPTLDRSAVRMALGDVTGRFQQVWTPDRNNTQVNDATRGLVARMLGAEFLEDVGWYLDDLRGRGPVIAVLLSNRMVSGNWNDPEIYRTAGVAAALGAPIYVLPLYGEAWTHQGGAVAGLRTLAEVTGGAVIPVVRDPEGAARQVLQEAAGLYVAGVPRLPTDTGDSPAELKVTLKRPQTTVRAPARLMIPLQKGTVISTFLAAARPEWATVAIRPRDLRLVRVPASPRPLPAAAREALARAGELVERCVRETPVVAADEQYEEHVKRDLPGREMPFRDRLLRSQLFLVAVPTLDETWLPFRDVTDVDGTAVIDWEHRLETAFSGDPDAAVRQAASVDQQSARFHIGTLSRRTISPMMPLLFLHTAHRDRFRFEVKGHEKIEGVPTERIDYVEQAQPPLARARRNNGWSDVRSQGSFWIDSATGRVLKATVLWDEGMFLKTELTATYAAGGPLAITPVTMKEVYSTLSDVSAPGLLIEATARYSNWRALGGK